jgi:hypothetical protein
VEICTCNPNNDMKSLYNNRVKENQLDAQLILSIFRQPLHVSAVSRPIIMRYNRMYATIVTYYSFLDEFYRDARSKKHKNLACIIYDINKEQMVRLMNVVYMVENLVSTGTTPEILHYC